MPNLYQTLFVVALVTGMAVTGVVSSQRREARRYYLIAVVGGVIGARTWFSLQYGLTSTGFSIFGFLLGAVALLTAYHRWSKGWWAPTDFPDSITPAFALGTAIHRLGCFHRGCCFGKICELPWAVRYPSGSHPWNHQLAQGLIGPSASQTLPIHPTQLYGVLTGLILFCLLLWILKRRPFPLLRFEVVLGSAIFLAVYRFFLEMLRDDAGGVHFGPLTFSQGTSLLILVGCSLLLVQRRIRYRRGDRSLLVRSPAP